MTSAVEQYRVYIENKNNGNKDDTIYLNIEELISNAFFAPEIYT